MKCKDEKTKTAGLNSHHMAVRTFVMTKQYENMIQNWKNDIAYLPFIQFVNTNLDIDTRRLHFDKMPQEFFYLGKTQLKKHFDQWRAPNLLPIALGGKDISSRALALFTCNPL